MLSLAGVEVRVDGWLIARRAAEGGFVAVEHDQQQRHGAAALAGLPEGAEIRESWLGCAVGNHDFQRRGRAS